MKTQGIEPASSWAKRGSEKSTLLRRAVRWGLTVLLPILIVGSLTTPRAFGQAAQISGLITDSSGARLPGANITIVNEDTGISRSVNTNTDGFYSVPLLQPGKYMITAKGAGFATQVRTGITLEVGSHEVLNLILQVGQMTQTVEVTAEAPTVELASSSISAVVNSTTVRELPLNGRSWTDLATLQPGISLIQTQPVQNENRGYGAQLAISGARPQQNNYRLDGVSLNDYSNGGPGSVLGGNLGVDAIQEFSVLTSNYPAEYGKSSGGVVNAVTRPGTNEFHGSVYEFLRNSALDARNFFDSSIPPFRRNQFGASAGGPIHKDRTFVFGDYEAIRQSLGVTSVVTVPSAAARSGQLCSIPDTPPTCTPTTVTVDPQIQKVLGIFALPNGSIISNGDLGVFSVAEQQIVSENFFTARVDHKFSDKDSLFGTYMFDNTPLTTPDNFNDVLLGSLTKRQALILEESHIFNPTLINSLRFGFNRDFANGPETLKAINPAAADPALGPVPGYNLGTLLVPGVDKFSGGLGSQSLSLFRWNSFQGYDDIFLTRGVHSFKFGVAVERDQLNELITSGPGGEVHFGSLSDFLTNQPQLFLAAFPALTTPRGTRQTILGLYAQDDWRFRPNLTLNLGLRYEMSTVPTEVQGKLSNLYNLTDSTPHLGDPYFLNPTLRNFEPRVGFAWDPFRNGKTAVRGGFGVYDSLPMLYEFATVNGVAAPFFEQGSTTTLPQGSFPGGAFSLLSPSSFAYVSIERKPPRNYVLQWNLNVQNELTPSLTAAIGYVGSRGIHNQFRSGDANIVMPTLTPQGYLWPADPSNSTLINTNAGAIRYIDWGGGSNYNSLEFGLTKRMSHGLALQSSFTWSKSIDTSSSGSIEDNFVNSISSLPWFDLKLNRAVSDFNIGRTLVISGTWEVPDRKSLSGPAAWIANGWELGAIYKANDGAPFSATFGSDGDPQGLNSTDPWAFPNRLTGPGCQTLTNPGNPNNYIKTQCFAPPTAPPSFFTGPTPLCSSDPRLGNKAVGDPTLFQCFNLRGNAGRNILTGPGLANLDFSVFKNNSVRRISENFKVQFRAELFNILNRPNFSVPNSPNNTDIFDSKGAPTGSAGLLTSTSTTSRQIQFALKFTW
jgi:hypothetical protein